MKLTTGLGAILFGASFALAQTTTEAPSSSSASAAAPEITAISACHKHGDDVFCMGNGEEYRAHITNGPPPKELVDCHSHGGDMYCVDEDGEDVAVDPPAEQGDDHDHDHEHGEEDHDHDHEEEDGAEEKHCHFHAGVEHCVGGSSEEKSCEAPKRDYNTGLRVGLLFVILATSAIGVYAPILLHQYWPNKLSTVFIVLKQFGTGIIISTAFVHLYTHASLMFGNECLGELQYEGTTSAILMAGLFLSFVVEYIGNRVVNRKVRQMHGLGAEQRAKALLHTEVVSIVVMEIGILFHSLLIGLTLVVAGDEFFITLFIVILFHQMFEGMALGSRIATIGSCDDEHIPNTATLAPSAGHHHDHDHDHSHGPEGKHVSSSSNEDSSNSSTKSTPIGLSLTRKCGLAALFAFITPIGMAIGIGVLQKFNGNDKSTIIAIGTLDALSAGILVWVGVVEMWAADWFTGAHGHKAELADAPVLTTILSLFGLVAGLIVMSALGKWA